jgi:hypothetical protein
VRWGVSKPRSWGEETRRKLALGGFAHMPSEVATRTATTRLIHATFTPLQGYVQTASVALEKGVIDVPHPRASGPQVATEDRREMSICATCELEVPWTPLQRGGKTFCCAGCAAGGPCTCSYDNFDPESSSVSIAHATLDARASPRSVPMTPEVLCRLQEEAERLAEQLPGSPSDGSKA